MFEPDLVFLYVLRLSNKIRISTGGSPNRKSSGASYLLRLGGLVLMFGGCSSWNAMVCIPFLLPSY